MNKDNCYQLGHITRTHGLKGEVMIFLDVDFPNDYADMESVFVEVKGQLIPYFIEQINVQRDNKAIVKFEDVNTIDTAQTLINCPLFMPDETLDDLEDDQFYYHEIIGFTVEDQKLGALGEVKTVFTMTAQDLIAMQYQGHEVLIPVNDDLILEVNRETKILHVNLPDGLIDVYLEESTNTPDDED